MPRFALPFAAPSSRIRWLFLGVFLAAAGCESTIERAVGGAGGEGSGDSGSGNGCARACSSDPDCCVGYVCAAGTCEPHIEGTECFAADFPVLCDPRLAITGCDGGLGCVFGFGEPLGVYCGTATATADLGEPCDKAVGCKPTLLCGFGDVCAKACCSADDCDLGEECSRFYGQLGSLGVCL